MPIMQAPVIDITKSINREGYNWVLCIECNTRFLEYIIPEKGTFGTRCDGCRGQLKTFIGRDGPPGTTDIDGDPDMYGYTTYIRDHLDIGKGFNANK